MPKFILFVHGYSETSLGAYFQFPAILKLALGASVAQIGLSGFDSLDDSISIDDLAMTMETRMRELEGQGWQTSDSAIICHSTGALIARRWILNRVSAGRDLPSHLITMAGANHGSTLAGMGKSVLGYLQKIIEKHLLTVGARVLTDLEYGSEFLLKLNREWLERWNSGDLSRVFAFSMGGDFIGGDPTLQIFWQTHESGSDNTVRISGANLNYTMIDASSSNPSAVTAFAPKLRVPHLLLAGYSHYGPQTGILGNVHGPGDPPMAAVLQALAVHDQAAYATVEQSWASRTQKWYQANSENANSTAIFSLSDQGGMQIDDCMIAILDKDQLGDPQNATAAETAAARAAAMHAVSPCVLGSPIQNDVQRGSYAFYLNYDKYVATSPHWFHIEVSSLGEDVTRYRYIPLTFTQPTSLAHTIAPNECTYVTMSLERQSDQAYSVYSFQPDLDLPSMTWLPPFPFPWKSRIAPP